MIQAQAPRNWKSRLRYFASPIMLCESWAAGDDTPPPEWVGKYLLYTVQFDVQPINMMIPICRTYTYLADNLGQRLRILAWCEDLAISPSTCILV